MVKFVLREYRAEGEDEVADAVQRLPRIAHAGKQRAGNGFVNAQKSSRFKLLAHVICPP